MHLKTRNVNTAFRTLVHYFHQPDFFEHEKWGAIIKRPSRNGSVLMIDEPVTITYSHPRERVLFNKARDWPCFFTLYEALWMLAGRNDVASVAYYAKQMSEYSDDGKTLNGAYGYRWRHTGANRIDNVTKITQHDQLDILVAHLKADPNSRRAVLQMWNVEDDLLKISSSKDTCCNLSVMFSIRTQLKSTSLQSSQVSSRETNKQTRYLDMTVTNRSNDMIWGLLGANYVHFTFLQEYMAARLGCEVGLYHHFTSNLHVYDWNWKPEEWLAAETVAGKPTLDHYQSMRILNEGVEDKPFTFVPLVKDPEAFERELPLVVSHFDGVTKTDYRIDELTEPFLLQVAGSVLRAFQLHKLGETITGIRMCELIEADDWRIACTNWLQRRKDKHAS